MRRASKPFPAPVSPRIRMGGSCRAAPRRCSRLRTRCRSSTIFGLSPASSARTSMAAHLTLSLLSGDQHAEGWERVLGWLDVYMRPDSAEEFGDRQVGEGLRPHAWNSSGRVTIVR